MKKKAGKRLSFLVTLALSAGLGTTVQPPSACAAEINVTTDRTADVDGGAADGNKVTIGAEGGGKHPRIEGNIIGGSAADAAKNLVDIKSVLLESPHAVYGGRGTDSASENTVNFAGGKVTSIYGGYTEGTGAVTKNTVQVTGGTLDGDVYGGKAEGTGAAQNNHVTVRLADTTHQINGLIVGGTATASTSAITGNSVSFEGGYIDIGGAAVGGFADASHTGDLKNNTFTLKGGEVSMGMGALAREGSGTVGGDSAADGNHAIVEGGKAYYGVCGGMAMGAGKVSYNTTTISGGEVETAAIGGWHNFSDGNDTAIIRRNSVTITGGSVKGFVHGGISDGAGTVTENTVTITGGTLAANDDGSCTQVYGGYVRGNGKAMGNIVNLGNASHDRLAAGTNLEHAILYGGNKTDDVTGNTLNVYAKNAVVNSVKNFDKYVFHLKGDAASDAPMLTLKATDGFGTLVDWNGLDIDTSKLSASAVLGTTQLLKSETKNALTFKNYQGRNRTTAATHGDWETALRTDTNAGTASSVFLDYNRFQNNTAVYDGTKAAYTMPHSDGSTTSEIYGGISYAGNTTANNHLTIKNLHQDTDSAYGGKTAGASGSSVKNSVTVAGTETHALRNIYGGYVENSAHDGAATENTVTITGGTISGSIYGGYTSGTGKATGNTVNLGDASHERLADGTNLEHATLYGGNKENDVTGNTLNVYAKNAVVNSVKNFDKYVFHLKGDAASDAPMLTLKAADGFGALVDWDKLSLDTANAANTQTIGKATLLKSETANALKFKNYAAKSQTSGDYETTLRTDTNAGTASSVLLDYNRFQNNTAVYDGTKAATPLAGGTSEIYGGISYKGNTAANNRLTINGLPSGGVTAAYGGKATNGAGGATGNRVTVSATGAEKIGSVYGGYTSGTGAVTGNTVTFSGGATLHDLMGGRIDNAASHADATGNTVTITGGSIGGSVYGGYTSGTGKTTGNTVRFTGGTVTGTIYGGSDAKDVKENTLVVSGKRTAGQIANFEKLHFDAGMAKANDMLLTLKGGAATAGLDWQKLETTGLDENRLKTLTSPFTEKLFSLMENAKGLDFGTTYDKAKEKTVGDYEYTIDTDTKGAAAQKVVVRGFRFQNNSDAKYETGDNKAAWGGRSLIGNTVQRNKLTVTGGTLESAYGGLNAKGNVTNNTLVLAGGTVKNAYGGFAESTGNATANIVDVRKDTQAAICGGHAAQGEASDNILYLGGVTIDADVCGGFGKKTEGNIINLWGTKIHGTVTGGTAPVASGGKANILAIRSAGTEIHDFTGVQNLKFYLPEGATSSMATMLKLGVKDKDIRGLHVDVDFSGAAKRLQQNETFSLMKLAEGGTLTTDEKIAGEITGTQGVSLDYKFSVRKKNTDEIIAAVEETSLKNETKSLVETRAAATDVLGGGMSLLADAGIASAVTAAAANVQTGAYTSWAAQGASSMRVHSGSYVDTHGYTLNVGFARKQTTKDGILTFGPFVEYGRASYDSYLEDAAATHGDGKVSYVGAGLLARQDWKSGFYLEGSVRGGRLKSDYAGIVAKKATSYDISNSYYAIHLGMGEERKLRAGDSLETYLKYFYSHQSGASAKLSTGEDYNFDAVNSHRLRLGARYAHDMGENGRFYAGLAWDYEFEGEARATYQGMTTPSPSLKGASAMLELGYRFAPKDSRVSYDLNVSGWQGKREGFTASVGMNWTF